MKATATAPAVIDSSIVFPALFEYIATDRKFIVLATANNEGIVVFVSEKALQKLGEVSSTWIQFQDTSVWKRLPRGYKITLEQE